jgi:hypothetical protein
VHRQLRAVGGICIAIAVESLDDGVERHHVVTLPEVLSEPAG